MALVLIVDDDTSSRQLHKSLLTPFGHEVIEADDGEEGLELARLRKPDLIITDILMPTMNGYEFVRALRGYPSLENIPIIFHSASFLDTAARSLGASCGVTLFIPKPCEPEAALATIYQALGLEVGVSTSPAQSPAKEDAIPYLLDAFFKQGKELDAVSLRLAWLLDLGLQLARQSDTRELLRMGGNAARKIIGACYAAVGILKEDTADLESLTLTGMDLATVEKIGKPTFAGAIFQSMMSERKPQRAFSADGESKDLCLPRYHPPVHSFLGAPLCVGNHSYGWIYVAQKLSTPEFDDEDERILVALAAQVGLAYENSLRLLAIQEHSKNLEAEAEERKKAEERFRMLIETAPMGIVIADKKGRMAEMNAQALRMFGYLREELIGKSVEVLLPERLRTAHEGRRSDYAKDRMRGRWG